MDIDTDELLISFLTAAKLANPSVQLDKSAIQINPRPAPHDPGKSKFREGEEQAVYAFFLNDLCLKVGKAGPHSGARFVSQHYGVKRAGSSLARSLLKYKGCQAFHRLLGDAGRSAIQGLDEHYRLQSIFEGRFAPGVGGLVVH